MTSTEIPGGGYQHAFSVNIWKLKVHWAYHLNLDWMQQFSSCSIPHKCIILNPMYLE
jgi:hypothetical protein